MNSFQKKRQTNIDLLRIVACFMVVLLHVSAQNWGTVMPYTSEWKIFNIYDCMVRGAVPLFFMISGKLFLEREEEIPIKKLLNKNILKLVIIYLVWSIFFAIDAIELNNISINLLIDNTLASHFHLWFIPVLIGTYLLIPIIYSFSKYKDGKYLKYYLMLFFIFGIIRNTILAYPLTDVHLINFLNIIPCDLYNYSGYFVLGYFISKSDYSKFKNAYLITMLFLTVFFTSIICEIVSINIGKPSDILYGYFSLPTFLESIIIFILFLKSKTFSKFNKNISNIIKSFSMYTLGIYLIHPFFIDHLNTYFNINTLTINPIMSVPLLSIITFLLSFISIYLISKIPFISKWIV